MLDAAESLEELRVPPGNRLERLRGEREGQYSFRINDQWRLCFHWGEGDAYDVQEPLLAPVHPGEILQEEFLKPLALSQYRLAKDIGVPPRRINEIVHAQRSITADTALRLARYFGTSERFWLNLQTGYDLESARDRLGERLTRDVAIRSVN